MTENPLASLARKALAESNTPKEAESLLTGWLEERDDLRAVVLAEAAKRLISEAVHRLRQRIEGSHAGNVAAAADQVEKSSARLSRVIENWFAWLIPGSGLPLGSATKDDLLAGAEESDRMATSNARKAAFQRALAKRLRGDAPVSRQLSEQQIEAVWRKCE